MKKNVGPADRVIRIAMAAIVAVLFVSNTISGTLALVLGAFAIILLITSFVNFCPLYWSFGINTRKPK
ncbi:hypothetical protein D3C84_87650 [compost metagenome]